MHPASAPPRNRLAAATSPYLLQHAANPVDWYPWSDEALERARREDRPILLSIGYSACHWCHVMAHESFEHAATAAVMNALFVNVKVDREERPDLDRVYQVAQQLITQRGGGWPLTLFLSPDDLVPFFGGTYFPREARFGMPAFSELLERVARYYREQRGAIRAQNGRLVDVLDSLVPAPPAAATRPDASALAAARAALERDFDAEFGGFGAAPKFPRAGLVTRLLRSWQVTAREPAPDLQALYMATLTLTRMAEGGLYDQLGGGFARYSVDAGWMIPHFEKMLYDNAALLASYAEATLATGDPLFGATARGTADWMLGTLGLPGGALGSSLDADSEGEEGRYYVWDRDELAARLDPADFRVLARRYGLDRPPNFEGRHWHLHVHAALDDVAREAGIDRAGVTACLERAHGVLLEARGRRVAPARDDKVLTAWNGLAVRGLALAARALERPDYAAAAAGIVDFLRAALWRDGRLLATHRDGVSHGAGYLDDHAFLLDGLLALLEVRWRGADLDWAIELAEALLAHFEDRAAGGFWFTADDAETLIHRPKSFADEALPSGNGVAARALGRLGGLLGEPRYLEAAARTLRAGWSAVRRHPEAHGALLDALEEQLDPPEIVILRGPAAVIDAWQRELARLYAPRRMVVAIPADAPGLPQALAAKPADPAGRAYVCIGTHCEAPLDSLPRLVARLRDGIGA